MTINKKPSIGIIDLPSSNVASWVNLLEYYGYAPKVIRQPDACSDRDIIILPGVGHFSNGAKYLIETGINYEILHRLASGQSKVIGICLGMHLLYSGSEEGNGTGLGIIDGQVEALSSHVNRVTNIGWGNVDVEPLLGQKVYFNHSYFVKADRPETVCNFDYQGLQISAMVRKGNAIGIQFHPEKSYSGGVAILQGLFHE